MTAGLSQGTEMVYVIPQKGDNIMTINRILRAVAGTMVLFSVALAVFHSLWWLLLTVLIGVNLLQSAFTDWCPLITILRKLKVQE